jgi:hypothetical protein
MFGLTEDAKFAEIGFLLESTGVTTKSIAAISATRTAMLQKSAAR